jgi:hypothetical protein
MSLGGRRQGNEHDQKRLQMIQNVLEVGDVPRVWKLRFRPFSSDGFLVTQGVRFAP